MSYEMPDYSLKFDDDQGQVVTSETADLNALTKKVLHMMSPAPVIDAAGDSYVELPAGLILDGVLHQEAEVQELTGEHEEKLAKARSSNNPAKYVQVLLQCGTVSIGGNKVTTAILDSLVQGDLDMLVLGIRRATFGDEFEVFNIPCPNCQEENDLSLNLKDIPIRKLEDPEQREFIVDLRKGRKAVVQLPDGALQSELFKKVMTVPEMNSVTLAHCVLRFIEADGSERACTGLNDVKKLGLADRKTLQDYLYNSQPGPRYDEVTAKCHSCEGDMQVPLSVGALFRDF